MTTSITFTLTDADIREFADAANYGNALGEWPIDPDLAVKVIAANLDALNAAVEQAVGVLLDAHARIAE